MGHARQSGVLRLSASVSGKQAGECTEEELLAILEADRKANLKLYPEHIHLLTKDRLAQLFMKAGYMRLHFDGVEGHLFLVAAI